MNLKISEITIKEVWENFLEKCQEKTFLQSWNWGEFNLMEGNKIWRWGIYESEELIALALVIKISAKRGKFLFVPHLPSVALAKEGGPIIKSKVMELLVGELKELAKKEKADFIRISPIWERTRENEKIFKNLGFRNSAIHIHPELTWELDITLAEEEILAGMRKTTRYLIKQAQKNPDIEIIKSSDPEDLKIFSDIYRKTARRHGFTPFSEKYLENELASFNRDRQISLFLGKYKGRVVSCAMIIYWQGIGFYHQGASLAEFNKVPVSYLLQWEAIREAKDRGCKAYNFWGVVPLEEKKTSVAWFICF